MIRIIIPAYNEEKNIKRCLLGISKELSLSKLKYRIYVVNDGSKDKTLPIASSLKKKLPILIINHPKNRGASEAFRTGFKKTAVDSNDSDIIIMMEADATSNPKLLSKIIGKIKEGTDIVICSRYIKGGKYKKFPLKRLVLSYLANFILKLIFPIQGVKDYTIFYRGYRSYIIKNLIETYGNNFIRTKNYVANSEILIKSSKITKNISEIPFVYNYGNKKNPSAMKIISNIKSYLNFILSQYTHNIRSS